MIHVKFIDGPLAGSEHFLTCRDTEKVVTIANALAERVVQVSEYELTDKVEGRTRLCKFIRAQTCVAPPPNTALDLPPERREEEQAD